VSGVPGGIRTHDPLLRRQQITLKQLNKISVSQLAELSSLSKACISQVKHGKRSPSPKLLDTEEKEAVMTAIGVLSWGALSKSKIKA